MNNPHHTPVVYLRGAGMPAAVWQRLIAEVTSRGWLHVTGRTQAFHLARGGVPVVLCDFSRDNDATDGPWYGYDMKVTVGRVRARYGQEPTGPEPEDVAATFELPLTNGGRVDRPYVAAGDGKTLDVSAVAGLIAAALGAEGERS